MAKLHIQLKILIKIIIKKSINDNSKKMTCIFCKINFVKFVKSDS